MQTAAILLLQEAIKLGVKLGNDYKDDLVNREEVNREFAELFERARAYFNLELNTALRGIWMKVETIMDSTDAARDPEEGFRRLLIQIFTRGDSELYNDEIPLAVRSYYASIYSVNQSGYLH